MVQAIVNETFLADALAEHYNFSKLNKTRISFKIQLKKTTKSNAPKWTDVLQADNEEESDLLKVKSSEVGLKGIKVFKALDEAASQLRSEIASVQEWMTPDNGDWVCPIDSYVHPTVRPKPRTTVAGVCDRPWRTASSPIAR